MKLVKMVLAASLVIASSQALAASVCMVSGYDYSCDGVSKKRDPIKTHNVTAIAQDLVTQGYKITAAVSSGSSATYMTMIFVKE